MTLNLSEIAATLETSPPAWPDGQVAGYSIDSRTLRPGELFFAVRGLRLDGHDYVKAALDAGAAAAVVSADRWNDFPAEAYSKLLAVPDTLGALQKLAAAVRRRWGGPLVAVTGSTGKTTTKQMIAALLRTRFRVFENEGNLNNQFGLPLSLLRLEPETEAGVFELAMSGPGEIRQLAEFAAPDLGVITNVAPVHLEFFPDIEAIARAKFELIETLGERAWAVLNADDPRVAAFGERMAGRALYYGITHPAEFRAEAVAPNGHGGWAFTVPPATIRTAAFGAVKAARRQNGDSSADAPAAVRFRLPLLGRHNVLNGLAALATGYLFGIPPASLVEALAELRPAPMRGEIVRLTSGALVVNDCYNSSPKALEAMLAAVALLPARRRIAVLGGMFELGPASDAFHAQCGARAAELRFDLLITVGEQARALAAGARAAGFPAEHCVPLGSSEEAGDYLRERLKEGDVVLLKASRAVHLEKAWERLGLFVPNEYK